MGVSTNGQLCFGVLVEDGSGFPWGDNLNKWWQDVAGFKPSFFPFDKDGNYEKGVSHNDPRIKQYYNELGEWEEANPVPVNVLKHCSADYPMYIIAINGAYASNIRGYPEKIDFDELEKNVTKEAIAELLEFVGKHGIETTGKPDWYLTSYWG